MSPRGAYNASWFQYPEYPTGDLSKLLEPTAVYVSHEHLDHFERHYSEHQAMRILAGLGCPPGGPLAAVAAAT